MEVITGSHHTEFPIGDASRVGEARRHAAQLARACGFDDIEAGRLAIIVTELTNNLLRHASGGRLLLASRHGRREVEVIAMDTGPGIADVGRSLGDGYSTGGTPGTGLGAVRRLASEFDIHSSVPEGTIVLARLHAAGMPRAAESMCVGAVSLPKPGESVCGDAWACAIDGIQAALLVADGLGHGPDAADASALAVRVFQDDPMLAPNRLVELTHARLRSSRGAAVTMLLANRETGTVRVSGAGNVMGRIVSGVSDRTLLTQHGTAGVSIRTPEESRVDWPAHALLVVYSDGIESRWKPQLLHPVLGHDPAVAAALLLREHSRGRDDATVAVLRRKD